MVKIFIEAKSKTKPEGEFLSAILKRIDEPEEKYVIVHTNGYTNLLDSKDTANIELMRANSDDGGKNLVIFDADTPANKGGFDKRRDALLARRNELGLDFDLFLWPDNQSDGDVEMLMESIARKDLYPEFFECFGKYEHCISRRQNDKGEPFYTTPNRKGKLHTYFNSIPISKTKKDKFGHGEWRWEDKDIWDLDAETLTPIKDFLQKNLK